VESRDGLHGLAVWALAVVLGAVLAAMIGAAALNRAAPSTPNPNASSAEPLLSYELDRLFRAPRRPANVDLRSERAEAGRILLTSSGHEGVSADDRSYLVQLVAGTTGLAPADAEKRVDSAIANAKTAITRTRRSTIILAFSVAALAAREPCSISGAEWADVSFPGFYRLLRKLGAELLGACFVIDLPELGGSRKLEALGVPV